MKVKAETVRYLNDEFFLCDMCGRVIFSSTFKTSYEGVDEVMPELCLECATNINKLLDHICRRNKKKSDDIRYCRELNEACRKQIERLKGEK